MDSNSVFILLSMFICLIAFVVTVLYLFGPKPKADATEHNYGEEINLDKLMNTLNSPMSNLTDLEMAVELFFKFYDSLELDNMKKKNFLFALALHRNVKAPLILKTEKTLKELNPNIVKDLERVVKKAIDMRGL